jgi:hypothetical protein
MRYEYDRDVREAYEAELEALRAQRAEEKWLAPRCAVRSNAAHPDSYRPDLPLRASSHADLTRATKQDRAAWAARPLKTTNTPTEAQLIKHVLAKPALKYANAATASLAVNRALAKLDLIKSNATTAATVVAVEPAPVISAPEPAPVVVAPVVAPKVRSTRADADAIRRAFIAWHKGRAYVAPNGQYVVINQQTGKQKPAPWAQAVAAAFPSFDTFVDAARAWLSPKNARTLATH